MFDNLLVAREGPIALVTIHRPSVRNALDLQTLRELQRAVEDVAADPGLRVVILTGAGDRAFAAGADIEQLARLRPDEAREYARFGQQVFASIERLGKPIIAAVNGYALGGGCELAMACTLRIAAECAMFGQPEIELGLLPGFGGTQRLAALVGRGRALDLLLTGRHITADEALRIGLVSHVVAPAALASTARELALRLAAKAPFAMRYIIDAVNGGGSSELEAALFGLIAATADAREGTSAFLDKRTPTFRGE